MLRFLPLLLLAIPSALLADDPKPARDVILTAEAIAIHREALLVDGHNDLPYALR